jgi:hypothetical protein
MADPRDEDALEAELVLLVDGQLEPERAAALEARPDLAPRIALVRAGRDQPRAAAASVEAPFELRRRVDALPARVRRRRWRPLGALAGLGAGSLAKRGKLALRVVAASQENGALEESARNLTLAFRAAGEVRFVRAPGSA